MKTKIEPIEITKLKWDGSQHIGQMVAILETKLDELIERVNQLSKEEGK